MKSLILVLILALPMQLLAQELKLGEYYQAEHISALLTSDYPALQNPSCLKDYLSTPDYHSRLLDGARVRTVSVCSRGTYVRINIYYNQMGGAGIGSINTLLNCKFKNSRKEEGCWSDY